MAEISTLFKEVVAHILENMNDENVVLLSSIAKATEALQEYDFHSVDNALCLVHQHFTGVVEDQHNRHEIYRTFASRLVAENAEQLTVNYNRILANVREFFPEFNLVHASHNPIFGVDAVVDCYYKKCSAEEMHAYISDTMPVPGEISDEERQSWVEELMEVYDTTYVESIVDKAKKNRLATMRFSRGIKAMLNYDMYTGKSYRRLNEFLRSIKTNLSINPIDSMVDVFNQFAQTIILPFYTQDDFVIYRGDELSVTPEVLTTKGFYSGGLSVTDIGHFVRNGGRMIQINIPKGVPFIPIVLTRVDEGEITLLPGTKLQKQREMQLQNGHFAEYTVVENPPSMTAVEEATILKHAIQHLYKNALEDVRLRGGKKGKRWVRQLPPAEGVAAFEDTVRFAMNLVNSKYGGDW